MKYPFLLLLFMVLVYSGCKSTGKKEIIGVDSMKVMMWDLMRADELYQRMIIKDSTVKKRKENIRLYETVFLLHKTSKGKFDTSYKYYASNPVYFKVLIDSLDAFATRERSKVFNYGQGH